HLTLITVAQDPKRDLRTKLTAKFDWRAIDELSDLRQAKVDYTLEEMPENSPTGTTLEIRRLKAAADFTKATSLRTDVLRIVTPLQGLDAGKFRQIHQGSKVDPGFRVILPGDEGEGTTEVDVAELVLRYYWARLQVELTGKKLLFQVWFSSSREPKTLELKVNSAISAGFVADIRY